MMAICWLGVELLGCAVGEGWLINVEIDITWAEVTKAILWT